jgi:putative salt-induced outer membrane protein YdiY
MRARILALVCVSAITGCGLAHAAEEPAASPIKDKLKAELARWSGNVNFGLTLTSGNSDSLSLGVSAAANRKMEKSLLETSGQLLYGQTDGDESTNRGELLARYSYFHSPKFFSYGEGGLYYDEFRNIDVGLRLAAGVGRKFIDDEKTKLNGRVGLAYTWEDHGMDADDEDYVALTAGGDYSRILNENVSVTFKLSVDQDLSEGENWILTAEAALKSKLSEQISLIVSATDRYDNDPPPGVKENDFTLMTAIGVAF